MGRTWSRWGVAAGFWMVAGCPSGDSGGHAADPKQPAAQGDAGADEEESLQVAVGDEGVEGPVPPQTSMVFFSVEGALYPLACFDHEKKSLNSGSACLKMVDVGADVRLASHDSQYNKKAGERVEPQCLAGSGRKVAIGVEGITEGADFMYGTWPPSGMKIVGEVDPKSTEPRNVRLDDDTRAKLLAAVKTRGGGSKGELVAHQVARVHAATEMDTVYSVFVPHPSLPEQYLWSGAFLAEGGDLDKLTLLEQSKTKKDVFEVRGWMDLDGDGRNELWMRLVFEEGAGDRIIQLKDKKAVPLGAWSCGAAR